MDAGDVPVSKAWPPDKFLPSSFGRWGLYLFSPQRPTQKGNPLLPFMRWRKGPEE